MRSIVGCEGYYSITSEGRVWNHSSGIWLSVFIDFDGYPSVSLYGYKGKGLRKVRLHILLLETFVGPRPPGMLGIHIDENPLNYRLDNLKWGTTKENTRQAFKTPETCSWVDPDTLQQCTGSHYARTWCQKHYRKWYNRRDKT